MIQKLWFRTWYFDTVPWIVPYKLLTSLLHFLVRSYAEVHTQKQGTTDRVSNMKITRNIYDYNQTWQKK